MPRNTVMALVLTLEQEYASMRPRRDAAEYTPSQRASEGRTTSFNEAAA